MAKTQDDFKNPVNQETTENSKTPEDQETTEDQQLPLSQMPSVRNTTTDTLSAVVGSKRYTVLPGRTGRVPKEIAAVWIKRKTAESVK